LCRTAKGGSSPNLIIDAAKMEGADIIIVQSELGLPQNVQIGHEFKDVDVILSAHSHELTLGAILADAQFGVGRVQHVDSKSKYLDPLPLPEYTLPRIIQPIEGSGPSFLKRIIEN
jgi:hypothetical protein